MDFFNVVLIDSRGRDNQELSECRRIKTDKTIIFDSFDIDTVVNALIDNNLFGVLSQEDIISFKWTKPGSLFTVYVNHNPKFQFEKLEEEQVTPPALFNIDKMVAWCFSKIDNNLSINNTNMIIASLSKSTVSNSLYVSYLLGQLRQSQSMQYCKRIVDLLHLTHLYIQNESQELYEGMINLYLYVKNEEA